MMGGSESTLSLASWMTGYTGEAAMMGRNFLMGELDFSYMAWMAKGGEVGDFGGD